MKCCLTSSAGYQVNVTGGDKKCFLVHRFMYLFKYATSMASQKREKVKEFIQCAELTPSNYHRHNKINMLNQVIRTHCHRVCHKSANQFFTAMPICGVKGEINVKLLNS